MPEWKSHKIASHSISILLREGEKHWLHCNYYKILQYDWFLLLIPYGSKCKKINHNEEFYNNCKAFSVERSQQSVRNASVRGDKNITEWK